jgi:hypothetical protein
MKREEELQALRARLQALSVRHLLFGGAKQRRTPFREEVF